MTQTELKPLRWTPEPDVGYTVERRPDGGLHFTFTDITPKTIQSWREFSLQHLYDSDRLTRNLYDLRQIDTIPEEAIQIAIEMNSDPAARNIRLAVVVGGDEVRQAIQRIQALTIPGGVEMRIFSDLEEAESWLSKPLDLLV